MIISLLDVWLMLRAFTASTNQSLRVTPAHPKQKEESKPSCEITCYKLYFVNTFVESLPVSELKKELKSLVDDLNVESLSPQCKFYAMLTIIMHKTDTSMLDDT